MYNRILIFDYCEVWFGRYGYGIIAKLATMRIFLGETLQFDHKTKYYYFNASVASKIYISITCIVQY